MEEIKIKVVSKQINGTEEKVDVIIDDMNHVTFVKEGGQSEPEIDPEEKELTLDDQSEIDEENNILILSNNFEINTQNHTLIID